MARILILRQRPDALDTAAALARRGHAPLILPTEEARALDAAPPPAGRFAGFLVTSANAVPAMARVWPGDGRPVLAVGERTAGVLRQAGFQTVSAGLGTAAALAEAAVPLAAQTGLPLLYAAGRTRMPALEAALEAAGVALLPWEAYEMVRLDPSLAAIEAATGGIAPDGVLLLSVGQAEAWRRLLRIGPRAFAPAPRLLCLSPRIAAALPAELHPACEISPRPDIAALFERFL